MKKLLYILGFALIIGCSSSDDSQQVVDSETKFKIHFNNSDYFGTIQKNDTQYLGWVWFWDNLNEQNQVNSYTISANISANENTITETPDDVFITFTTSTLQENHTYPISEFKIYLDDINNGYFNCTTCTGSVTITDISTIQKSQGINSTAITGSFSVSSSDYGLITGTFKNIPE